MSDRSPASSTRAKLVFGLAVHAFLLGAALTFVLSSAARAGVERVASILVSGLVAERDTDLVADVDTVEGLEPGLPAFVVEADGSGRPVAHVVDWSDGRVRLRFEPGETSRPYRVLVYPPRRRLRSAYELAVPADVARKLGDQLQARLIRLWNDELREDFEARLPAFFEHIDPRGDNATREVLDGLGTEAFRRAKPHLDDLVDTMTDEISKELSGWERAKLVGGGLVFGVEHVKKKLLPIAEQAALDWWEANRDGVLTSMGQALESEMPTITKWIATDLADAAKEELVLPLFEQHRARLEAEGEALVALVLDDIIRVPEGGFQVRFAAMLRHVLLRKDTAFIELVPA